MSHGHSHGGCNPGDHSHEHPDLELGKMYTLFTKIDIESVQCLNESIDGSAKRIFKPWDERKDKERYVESDTDEELLINIPFTGSVKLKGIIVIGGEEDSHPSKMRVFKNKSFMTFDDTAMEAEQEFELHPDPEGVLEYNPKIARFNNVNDLSLHFPANFGSETTRIYYIGLKGDFTEVNRQEVVIANYELKPNPADHKQDALDPPASFIS
ncbi:PITH domain-containing protein 1-like [Littorina saxatilis]|uniref:PITH domain-containing protein n=1 Tax=Littorina saxatilis TaxID=31220 RepID=A0AAN9B6M0_9CAEN